MTLTKDNIYCIIAKLINSKGNLYDKHDFKISKCECCKQPYFDKYVEGGHLSENKYRRLLLLRCVCKIWKNIIDNDFGFYYAPKVIVHCSYVREDKLWPPIKIRFWLDTQNNIINVNKIKRNMIECEAVLDYGEIMENYFWTLKH